MYSIRWNKNPITCPKCDGKGELVKQWGYCPDISSDKEQLKILKSVVDDKDFDKYKILRRIGSSWTILDNRMFSV